MYSYKGNLVILLFVLTVSCNEAMVDVPPYEEPVDTTDEDTSELIIRWQTALIDSTSRTLGAWPAISDNLVLYTDRDASSDGSGIYVAFDLKTGKEVFRVDRPELKYRTGSTNDLHEKDNNFFITALYDVFSLSPDGNVRWHYKINKGTYNTNSNIIGNHLYYNVEYPPPSQPTTRDSDSAKLARFALNTGEREDIYTLYKQNGFSVSTRSAELWMHPEGDSILIFQCRLYNSSEGEGRVDLYAYNMSADSVYWKLVDLTPSGSSSIELPQVKNDHLYFQGNDNIIKIDALTGEIIWMFNDNNTTGVSFIYTNLIIKEGLVIANSINAYIYGIDAANGKLKWKKGNVPIREFGTHTPTNMIYHQGYIYFGSLDKLICMKATNGEVIWDEPSPNERIDNNPSFSRSGVAIDRGLELLYVSDGYYVMAVELYEP